jgi:membrane-bound transcription factor site-1 protease
MTGGCRTLSGTSVASPVVAGVVALLASTIEPEHRSKLINPASMKQILVEGAERVRVGNVYEQGFGKLNLLKSYDILQSYTPRASFLPSSLDLTDCPYMWPLCTQPIYHTHMPLQFNVTILNGMDVVGEIESPPVWVGGTNGEHIEIAFTYSKVLWPWVGYLALSIRVPATSINFTGIVEGLIRVDVVSVSGGEHSQLRSTIELPLRVSVIATPPRAKRILWDQYHSLRYPSGYFPRDALWVKNEPFDWNADHLYTNFRGLYNHLRSLNYYMEILGEPLTCFNAENYGILMIVDTEDYFHEEEYQKLYDDVVNNGLSLFVAADWYDLEVMNQINFFDENTRQWWEPVTGGCNLPALNSLLSPFGIGFGARVFDGNIGFGKNIAHFASGVGISRFPGGNDEGMLYSFELNDQSSEIVLHQPKRSPVSILGLLKPFGEEVATGRVVVFGDSSCLDDAHQDIPCYWLAEEMLLYISTGTLNEDYQTTPLPHTFMSTSLPMATYPLKSELATYSRVIGKEPQCNTFDFITSENTSPRAVIHFPNPVYSDGPPLLADVPQRYPLHDRIPHNSEHVRSYVLPWIGVCFALGVLVTLFRKKKDVFPRLWRSTKSVVV